jgi:hypothetical protein
MVVTTEILMACFKLGHAVETGFTCNKERENAYVAISKNLSCSVGYLEIFCRVQGLFRAE